jgi:hypothetical protein
MAHYCFETRTSGDMHDIITRAVGMLRAAAQQWLSATVWRTVWSIPLPVVIIIAVLLFILLAVFG